MAPPAPDLLAAIVAATRRIVEVRAREIPLAEMERRAGAAASAPGRFKEALLRRDRLNVIAECKRRSPSRGVLRQNYEPAALAAAYAQAGAAAVSVLTEPTFFDGSLEHLAAVRAAVALPILRKDFIVDRYQLLEARTAGADAVLLIVAALSAAELRELHASAIDAGLEVLVEVHQADEVPIAVDSGAQMIGVNNRDLRTLAVDGEASNRLIRMIPRDVVSVAESGLKTRDDLERLRTCGYHAFLIGERFMTADDPGSALAELLKGQGPMPRLKADS
ncbi:MAG TPA: indole-3-glycerol phosphate synthase TrpC [Vicinamibacterales bacterium]|nr:indole-3-glycerol phosphate synthase TrpC [Vicinamibacterales bacterium]